MAAKSKKIKRSTSKKLSMEKVESITPKSYQSSPMSSGSSTKKQKYIFVAIFVLIILGLLLFRFRNWFVVATVNGQPITRMELNKILMDRYGKQTLDNLVSEKLVNQELAKKGIVIEQSQIDAEVNKAKTSIPQGMSFADALSFQGLTENDFREQLRLRLAIEKLLSDKASVSGTEVDSFIKENKSQLTATDEANLKKEAEARLKQQKIQDSFQKWFEEVKKNAKIDQFI